MRPGDFLDKIILRFKRGTMDAHYDAVFGTDSGRIVLADLCREGGLLHTVEGLSLDAVMFNAGKRHMVTHILAKLRALPQGVQQLGNLQGVEERPHE